MPGLAPTEASQPAAPGTALVLGLGNTILSDEGLGVRAMERLVSAYELPPGTRALDGGVMGLDLLPCLEGFSSLLVLDAVQTGRPPGSLVRLEGEQIHKALAHKMSMHQVGLQELLAIAALQGILPPRVVVWGMEPASLATGCELSAAVAERLDELAARAAAELRGWAG